MDRVLRMVAGLLVAFVSLTTAWAQQAGLIPVPALQNVLVQAQTSFDVGTQFFTYRYTITNPAGNTGQIRGIHIDITRPANSFLFFGSAVLTIPIGGQNLFFEDFLSILAPLNPLPMVPLSLQVPSGWDGGIGASGFAAFSSGDPLTTGSDRIIPGQTKGGFALISAGLPTIRQIEFIPVWVFLVDSEETITPEDEQQAQAVKDSLRFMTKTLGPSAVFPGSFAHWDQLRDDLNQAIQLGWVPDPALVTALVNQLASARQAQDAFDGTTAKIRLQPLLDAVNQATPGQIRQEARDVVLLNVRVLIANTTDTPIPIEPKFSLSPTNLTLPIGGLASLTATVVNAADHDNPLPGFLLSILVTDGPNTGLQTRGITDDKGQLIFSYIGSQLGTDRVSLDIPSEVFVEVGVSLVNWTGGPDLVIQLFVPPVIDGGPGKSIPVTETTGNIGNAHAGPSVTRYFLSTNPIPDPIQDQPLGERPVPPLAAGEASQASGITLHLPDNLPAGTYRLGACADAGGTVAELNEQNNCRPTQVVVALRREVVTNQPPLAQAGPDQTLECKSPSGSNVTLDGTASSDPDGDPLTFRWADSFGTVQGTTQQVTLPLGAHTVTLTVEDGKGGSASDTVTITVADRQPPTVTAAFTRLASERKSDKRREQRGEEEDRREDDDQNRLQVVARATDGCDPHPSVQAAINGVPVMDGQVVRLTRDDDTKVSRRNGVLHIVAPNIVLTVSATDASGNGATAQAKLGKERHEHDD